MSEISHMVHRYHLIDHTFLVMKTASPTTWYQTDTATPIWPIDYPSAI